MEAQKVVMDHLRRMTKRRVAQIEESDHLKDQLGLSSLELVSLVTGLCAACNVNLLELTDADLVRLKTVGDLIQLMQRKL